MVNRHEIVPPRQRHGLVSIVGAFSVITNLRMELFEALIEAEAGGAVQPQGEAHLPPLRPRGDTRQSGAVLQKSPSEGS